MSKLYDLLSAMCGKIKKPDWNQNDSTAPDYVKNRTHYEETVGEYVCFDGEVALGETATVDIDYVIPVGTVVEQYHDGSLLCTVTTFASSDMVIASDGRIQVTFENNTATVGNYLSSGIIKIVAKDICVELKQLDEKYIPETIARATDIPTDDYIMELVTTQLPTWEGGSY